MRAPNLVPLLDVMIVILIYLMLLADFEPRSQEPLDLAAAVRSQECIYGQNGPSLTINVHHRDDRACAPNARGEPCGIDEHWQITVDGRECTEPVYLRTVLVQEAVRIGPDPHRRRICLRSDAAAPAGLAQRAMNACALLGFDRVHVAVRSPRRS